MQEHELLELANSPRSSILGRFFDALPIGASLALDGRTAYVNAACARMFGYRDAAEMANVGMFELIDPEFHDFVIRLWNLRSSRTDPWTYDLYGRRRDGSAFPYRCTSVSANIPGRKATFVYLVDLSGSVANTARGDLHAEHDRLLAELESQAEEQAED